MKIYPDQKPINLALLRPIQSHDFGDVIYRIVLFLEINTKKE